MKTIKLNVAIIPTQKTSSHECIANMLIYKDRLQKEIRELLKKPTNVCIEYHTLKKPRELRVFYLSKIQVRNVGTLRSTSVKR